MERERILLEGICSQIDDGLAKEEKIDTRFLTEYVGGLPSAYKDFAREYFEKATLYQDRVEQLNGSNKDKLVNSMSEMNFQRLFWNTVWGGLAGGAVGQDAYNASAGAAIGFGLTITDELTKSNANLTYTFWGVILGGWLGSSYVGEYIGAAIGGGLGLAKAVADVVKTKKKESKTQIHKQLTLMEMEFDAEKEAMIEKTLPKLLEDNLK